MKKSMLSVFCAILLLAFSAAAQEEASRYSSSRLDDLLTQLKGVSVDLVDRTSEDLRGRNGSSRQSIEAAFLAQQLDASVGFFQEFIRDGRRANELRDAAGILSDLVRRAPGYGGSSGNLWRDAQRAAADISRELGGTGNGNNGNNNGNGNNGNNGNNSSASGSAIWRGTVDNEVQLFIQNRNIETRTIAGTPYTNENFSFTSSLPNRRVGVEVLKKSGRGQVRVIQQPSRDNDFVAVIQILDDGSGAREYQLEIVWR